MLAIKKITLGTGDKELHEKMERQHLHLAWKGALNLSVYILCSKRSTVFRKKALWKLKSKCIKNIWSITTMNTALIVLQMFNTFEYNYIVYMYTYLTSICVWTTVCLKIPWINLSFKSRKSRMDQAIKQL